MTTKNKNPQSDKTVLTSLSERRVRAVEMRIAGEKLAAISEAVNLSQPTIINAYKAFLDGGWDRINQRARSTRNKQVTMPLYGRQLCFKTGCSPLIRSKSREKPLLDTSTNGACLQHFKECHPSTKRKHLTNWRAFVLPPIESRNGFSSQVRIRAGKSSGYLKISK